jgi:hypothetical protein
MPARTGHQEKKNGGHEQWDKTAWIQDSRDRTAGIGPAGKGPAKENKRLNKPGQERNYRMART